jgi:hypothetical protein
MMASQATLQLPPLTKKNMAQLRAKAKSHGVRPEDYARELLEEGLALQREAEGMTFAEIMAPVRRKGGVVNEAEIVGLVEKARTEHHRSVARKRKK